MNKIKKIINLILDFYQTLLISCINKNKKFSYIYVSIGKALVMDHSLVRAPMKIQPKRLSMNCRISSIKKKFNQYSIYHVVIGNGCQQWIFNM